jgi:hypothetical protein
MWVRECVVSRWGRTCLASLPSPSVLATALPCFILARACEEVCAHVVATLREPLDVDALVARVALT